MSRSTKEQDSAKSRGRLGAAQRTPEHVEVQARIGTEPGQQSLPQAQRAVDLPGVRPSVTVGVIRPAAINSPEHARQVRPSSSQPQVGQPLGQGARRLVGQQLLGDPHAPRPRIFRCHGSSAHLPGSYRAG